MKMMRRPPRRRKGFVNPYQFQQVSTCHLGLKLWFLVIRWSLLILNSVNYFIVKKFSIIYKNKITIRFLVEIWILL